MSFIIKAPPVTNFGDDNDWSNSPQVQAFWTRVYQQLPGYSAHWVNENAIDAQLRGVDTRIFLKQDIDLYIDEKSDRNQPNNFVLEYQQKYKDGSVKPGWIEKPLAIHHIAYGFIRHGVAYLLPWLNLQAAWRANRAAWIKQYRTIETPNRDYVTLGLLVPIPVVQAALIEFSITTQQEAA